MLASRIPVFSLNGDCDEKKKQRRLFQDHEGKDPRSVATLLARGGPCWPDKFSRSWKHRRKSHDVFAALVRRKRCGDDDDGQESDHDLRPEGRRHIRGRIQDGCRPGDGDLHPENRGRSDPALSKANAVWAVRAGGAFSRAAFLMGLWRVTIPHAAAAQRAEWQPRHRLYDQREAVGQIVTPNGYEPRPLAIPADDDTEAVVLDLMKPERSRRRTWGRHWQARRDEACLATCRVGSEHAADRSTGTGVMQIRFLSRKLTAGALGSGYSRNQFPRANQAGRHALRGWRWKSPNWVLTRTSTAEAVPSRFDLGHHNRGCVLRTAKQMDARWRHRMGLLQQLEH